MGNSSSEQGSILDRIGDCFEQTNLCLRPEYESDELINFTEAHHYISLYKDPYYGQCHILENKTDSSLCVMIKETLDRKDHVARLENLNEIIISGQGPANKNIIRASILADLEKVGFLWRKNELYIKYDYILFDLEKEFQHRMNNNLEFGEAEIKTIIKESTKGYLRLELTKYTSVRMKHIYFCDDGGQIRLAHPKLFNYRSNLEVIYEDYSTKNIYLSPEQIYALQISNKSYECGWASNAFSFGMIILSLMTMKHLNEIYNYQSCQINFKKINELINICNNRYSYHLVNIVQELLREKQSQRLIFRNLYNKIQSNQVGRNPIQLTLVQENPKQLQQYKIERKAQEIIPKYPNFIAAMIKPIVDLNGQYMSLTNEDEPAKNRQSAIVASQRFRYSTVRQESVGSYMGEAVNRETSENVESVRHGKGVYQYKDGQTYMGEWKDGKMHGYGKLYYSDKKLRYEGQFKHGLFHGYGTEYTDFQMEEREEQIDEEYIKIYKGNWIKYEGYYFNDKKEGAGKIYFKNGFWRGNFKKGQPNGEGIYTCYISNKSTKGEWAEGIIKKRK